MNNSVFGKAMENIRKHTDIKSVTTDKRRNQLVSEPNYHTIKWFSESLLAIEMKKIKLKMNKPVYLGLSILEISKTLMYEFCMTILNQSISKMQKCLIINIKTEDIYKDIADDVEKLFDTSNYECNRPLSIGKSRKILRFMTDELMTEFVGIKPKPYSY